MGQTPSTVGSGEGNLAVAHARNAGFLNEVGSHSWCYSAEASQLRAI